MPRESRRQKSTRERRGMTREQWAKHDREVNRECRRWRKKHHGLIKTGRVYGDEFVEYLGTV